MCKSILKGQNVPGTDGTYHGTDGTCPRDRRDAHQGGSRQNSLCLLGFFLSPFWGGGAQTLEKQGRKIRRKILPKNSVENMPAIFTRFARPKKTIKPNPLCRTSGSREWVLSTFPNLPPSYRELKNQPKVVLHKVFLILGHPDPNRGTSRPFHI